MNNNNMLFLIANLYVKQKTQIFKYVFITWTD